MKKKILIVDDEPLIRSFISSYFETSTEYSQCSIDVAVNGEEAIAKIKEKEYDLIFTDLKMPGKSGLDVIKFATEHSPATDSVLITAYGGGESASKAMAYGAYEYITKPVALEELEMIVKHIFERQDLIAKNRKLTKQVQDQTGFPKIIGKSKAISDIMDVVKMVARTNSTVLITGESGTGKELIAEAIHGLSSRNQHNFVKINCAALPENLIESELFGFEKGAFTGAIKRTRGKFEMADKGSILLDEISEMNLDLQAKLLRVIQEKEIVRIGSETPQKIDTRIVATSNRELSNYVEEGKFREDLFFRLNIIPVHLPPLRKRKDDIPLLAESFVKKICFNLGAPKKVIAESAMQQLVEYDWPGNIRELQNAVERAVITNPQDVLTAESFQFLGYLFKNRTTGQESQKEPAEETVTKTENSVMTIAEMEKQMIFDTLEKTGNNRTEAAKILGITTRTLRNKLHQYESEEE